VQDGRQSAREHVKITISGNKKQRQSNMSIIFFVIYGEFLLLSIGAIEDTDA
jgi:hypothetical protein